MKANELRIGNLIYHGWIGRDGYLHDTILVTGIMKNFVILDDNRLPDYLNLHEDKIEPIPLTEEWLIKFGFKIRDRSFYEVGQFLIYKNIKGDMTYGEEFYIINTVHQLQNIYFALTNEELTIK